MLSRGIITIEGVLTKVSPEINLIQIMVNHIKNETISNTNIQKQIIDTASLVYNSSKKSLELPLQISDLIKIFNKGQGKLNLELIGSEEPLNIIDHMANKIILCIINAAILLASSLIATTQMTPTILGIPLFGFLGYVLAMVLSLILVCDILKKKIK